MLLFYFVFLYFIHLKYDLKFNFLNSSEELFIYFKIHLYLLLDIFLEKFLISQKTITLLFDLKFWFLYSNLLLFIMKSYALKVIIFFLCLVVNRNRLMFLYFDFCFNLISCPLVIDSKAINLYLTNLINFF